LLAISWFAGGDNEVERRTEFWQYLMKRRKSGLDHWGEVIMKLKNGELSKELERENQRRRTNGPAVGSLQWRVLYILGDLRGKGLFQIEGELKAKFPSINFDSEEIEAACSNLQREKWIICSQEPNDIPVYRQNPPLGPRFDLSA